MIGKKFGKWLVIEFPKNKKYGTNLWLCRCECGLEKEVSEVSLNHGLSKGCRKCFEDTVKIRPYEALYNQFVRTVKKSKKHSSISYEDFLQFTHQKECFYCGKKISWLKYTTKSSSRAYHLDRKDNSLGYSVENCVVCCAICNRLKSDMFSFDEMCLLSPVLKRIQYNREALNEELKWSELYFINTGNNFFETNPVDKKKFIEDGYIISN